MRAPSFWWRNPGVAAQLLRPAAWIYGVVAGRRLADAGCKAGVPVVCIGNPTVGGAGKTPTAIAIANLLTEAGERPVFLTRGYGGTVAGPAVVDPRRHTAAEVGDEPLLLVRHAPVIVAGDRAAGAEAARAAGASVIGMDDGVQNPALAKDLSILVIDARRGVGNAMVLPAGPLRAPLAAQLARAQAVLVVGAGDGAAAVAAQAVARGLPVLRGRLVPDPEPLAALAGRRVLAFAGIGDPDKFFATLTDGGVEVTIARRYPDHHRFTPAEAAELMTLAELDSVLLVTTEKDRVRFAADPALAALAARTRTLPVTLAFDDVGAVRTLLRTALARG